MATWAGLNLLDSCLTHFVVSRACISSQLVVYSHMHICGDCLVLRRVDESHWATYRQQVIMGFHIKVITELFQN